jgi:hypothetical protein
MLVEVFPVTKIVEIVAMPRTKKIKPPPKKIACHGCKEIPQHVPFLLM